MPANDRRSSLSGFAARQVSGHLCGRARGPYLEGL